MRKKNMITLCFAALLGAAFVGPQQALAATPIRYNFEFTIFISNDARYEVGASGTGLFSFEEQDIDQGIGGWVGVNTNYTTLPFALEIEINGQKTTLINSGGFVGSDFNTGVIVQDIPTSGNTHDLFRVAGGSNRLSIFASAPTITDYSLNASNVDKLWANRATGGSSIEIVNNFVHARLTSLERVSAVPEPATWVMMISGFAMIGIGMRRRRRKCIRSHA